MLYNAAQMGTNSTNRSNSFTMQDAFLCMRQHDASANNCFHFLRRIDSPWECHYTASPESVVLAKIISDVPDKMYGRCSVFCRTFWTPVRHFFLIITGKYQWSFLFALSDLLCVLKPAGQNAHQGLSSLSDISRSLPDMSGMFRDHWICCASSMPS